MEEPSFFGLSCIAITDSNINIRVGNAYGPGSIAGWMRGAGRPALAHLTPGPDAVPARKLSFDLPVAPGQPQCIVRPIQLVACRFQRRAKDGNRSAALEAGQADPCRRRRGDDPHAAR